jgi:hypothetical protein
MNGTLMVPQRLLGQFSPLDAESGSVIHYVSTHPHGLYYYCVTIYNS